MCVCVHTCILMTAMYAIHAPLNSRYSVTSDEDDMDELALRKPSGMQDRQWFSSLRNA